MAPEVTEFLDTLNLPLRSEIDQLREYILSSKSGIAENIKWNGPNYTFNREDRITMKIRPPKNIQLIFHRGAKVLEMPKEKLLNEDFGLLSWKTNDRAVATFVTMEEIVSNKENLSKIVNQWIEKCK
jgi:hypothetical protein